MQKNNSEYAGGAKQPIYCISERANNGACRYVIFIKRKNTK